MEEDRVRDELNAVKEAVEQLTGLRSRWSGNVILLASREIVALKGTLTFAEKRWNCDVLVNADLIATPTRWRTYIHEMLHSVSVGLNETDVGRFRGWEEGVVEQTQRLFRQDIFTRIRIDSPESAYAEMDRLWKLNSYIKALEELRQVLLLDAEPYYLRLLQTPLNARLGLVRGFSSEPDYQRLFAYTIGKLR